jgi:HAD superfamily hydrolase (TIGR01509 family)
MDSTLHLPPHALDAILFDFDGTIAETERSGHRVAYNAAFAQLGLDWTWDTALYGELLAVSGGKERIAHYLDRYRAGGRVYGDRTELLVAVHERKQQIFSALAGSIALRPGVRRVVREARAAGLRLAIVTTAAPAGVDAVLDRDPELRAAFDLIAAGDIVPRKKPAPDIYAYALEKLGAHAQCCIAIEDAAIGLRAARTAGIATLVTVSEYTRGEDFSGAAAVLSDLGEPGAPAQAFAGPSPPDGIVDVTYLREILQAYCSLRSTIARRSTFRRPDWGRSREDPD